MATISKEILVLIIESSGKTTKEFAAAINIHSGTVCKWLAGTAKPRQDSQTKIRTVFKSEFAKLYK